MRNTVIAAFSLVGIAVTSVQANDSELSYFGEATVGYNTEHDFYYNGHIGINYYRFSFSAGQVDSATNHYEPIRGMRYGYFDSNARPGPNSSKTFGVRADAYLGFSNMSLSYEVATANFEKLSTNAIAFGVSTDTNALNFAFAYQREGVAITHAGLAETTNTFGASAGYDFGALETKVAYLYNSNGPASRVNQSLGFDAKYSFGQYGVGGFVTGNTPPLLGDPTTINYGVSAEFTANNIDVEFTYSAFDRGASAYYDVDASYELGDDVIIYAGYGLPAGGGEGSGYVGVVYSIIDDAVEVGAAYSNFGSYDRDREHNFDDGASVWISASY